MPRDTIIQDNARETKIAQHLGITPSQKRAGDDALDQAGNPYELKSATKDSVTTARDVSVHTIRDWRKQYWVVAQGSKTPAGDFVFSAIWVIHPADLEPWFSKWEKILEAEGRRCKRVLQAAKNAGADAADIDFVEYVCQRGVTRNNPKIPIKLIEAAGTSLDPVNAAAAARQLKAFVKKRPLPSGAGVTKSSSASRRRRPPSSGASSRRQ